MSVFVGIFPSEEAIAHLSNVVDGLGLNRHSPTHQWHVTVAFLGDADEAAAARAMQEADLRAMGELSIKGAGQFSQGIFWAGLSGDVDGLRRLNRNVRRAMRAERISPDDRLYRPHLTLARPRKAIDPLALETMKTYQGPAWPVQELILVRSEYGPPPEYVRLGTWPLRAA